MKNRPKLTFPIHLLAALLLALTLALTLACGGAGADDENGDTQITGPTQTMEAIDSSLATLRAIERSREDEEPTDTPALRATARPASTAEPATPQEPTRRPPPTPLPQTAPQLVALPGDAPGICARSPELQQALLDHLNAFLCAQITVHELYRIVELPELTISTVSPGDFAGLDNVTSLTLRVLNGEIPEQAFAGMTNLRKLTIYANDYHPRSLSELQKLQTLDLLLNDRPPSTNEADYTQRLPRADLPQLTSFSIGNLLQLDDRTLKADTFEGMPNLTSLTIVVSPKAFEVHRTPSIRLPNDLLRNNHSLTSLELRQGSGQRLTLNIPETLFAETFVLAEINIYTYELTTRRDTFLHLHSLETLRINGIPADNEPTIALSPNSPLYNNIYHGYETPYGFILEETGS